MYYNITKFENDAKPDGQNPNPDRIKLSGSDLQPRFKVETLKLKYQ